jgi:hypothetical protein
MKTTNFKEKLRLYLKSNPNLSYDDFGILLLIDNIYHIIPNDMQQFRMLFAHFDPKLIFKSPEGVLFLDIVNSKNPASVIKHRLNQYINIKFNYLGNTKPYAENMVKFKRLSIEISKIYNELLSVANLPKEVINIFKEKEIVKNCHDFYKMHLVYKKTNSNRIKFEILRKIGLIVLLSRINKTLVTDDIDFAAKRVRDVFQKGFGMKKTKTKSHYLWINEHDMVESSESKRIAFAKYQNVMVKRNKLAMPIYPMQIFEHTPYKTIFNSEILHFSIRNKLRNAENKLTYSSLVEKIIRKNIEFPNLVHDIIGVKLVVSSNDEIIQLIKDIQSFLGGSSTRKKEKNTLFKFGKKKMGEFSSKDFTVWKAVYDITIPDSSKFQLINLLQENSKCVDFSEQLKKRLLLLKGRVKDIVVEVQIQNMQSYLLSIAKGSKTDHSQLKMNQVKGNSLYKFFPQEIYERELLNLKNEILRNNV